MRVLVTGANGFLGRAVIGALLQKGHEMRALVRPAAPVDGLWAAPVEVVRADLRQQQPLAAALDGADAVIHLAGSVRGDDHEQFASMAVGTEHLLAETCRSWNVRVVLASSIAVYDWSRAAASLTERSPLTTSFAARGGYARAKVWQERVARRMSDEHGLTLTVLRPGIVWGANGTPAAGWGRAVGRVQLVIGPSRPLPLTYVENCAHCFVAAATEAAAAGETFNVVDPQAVTAWRFAAEHVRRTKNGFRVPIPYRAGKLVVGLAAQASHGLFGPGGRLPSILVPARYEASFKPVPVVATKVRQVLGWEPPYSFDEALDRTYGPPPA